MKRASSAIAMVACVLGICAARANAEAYTWSGPDNGNWVDPANWSPAAPAFSNNVADTAEVTSGIIKDTAGSFVNTTFSPHLILRSGTTLNLGGYHSDTLTSAQLDGATILMGGATNLAGSIEVTAASTIRSGSSDNNTISAVFSGSGDLDIYNYQPSTRSVAITGNSSTYSGTWTVYDANGLHRPTNFSGNLGTGELHVTTGAVVGVGASTTLDWTLDLDGGTIYSGGSAGAYHHTGTVTLLSDATIRNTTDYSGKHVYMDGEITGNAKLSLAHGTTNRKVILNHANTYTGGTEVINYTARVSAAEGLSTGDLHVDTGATLEIAVSGVMSTLADVYLDSDGVSSFGKLNLSTGTLTIVNYAFVGGTGGWETPVDYTALTPGDYTSAELPDYITGTGTLRVLAVPAPEPATLAMLAVGGLTLAGTAGRRRG